MLFYNFTTLDDFIKNNLIENIEDEKARLENTIEVFSNKKDNLLNLTTNILSDDNISDKNKIDEFRNTIDMLKSSFQDFETIRSLADELLESLTHIINLYDENLDLNYNEIKAELIEYNKKNDVFYNNILDFDKNTSNLLNSAIELTDTSKNDSIYESYLKSNEANNSNLHIIKDNNTLLISEKEQLAFLPYKYQDLEKIYKNSNGKYSSTQDVINKLYIIPLSRFKNSSISRFRESFNLVKNKENGSILKALELGLELMFKYNLNPIVISACKNLDELDIYLDCLDSNELFKFDCFEIKFEVNPQITNIKNNEIYG